MKPLTMAWSLRRIQQLRQLQGAAGERGWRAAWAATNQRGQMAVTFIVLIALMILLAAMTMNLGEIARLKTSTANAADAGALAGASWVASGTNEAAFIARGMWINVYLVQIFLISCLNWCIAVCWYPVIPILLLWAVAEIFKSIADDVMDSAFENAKGATLFTTIQNLAIDDRSGVVREQLKQLSIDYEDTENVPTTLTLGPWMRKGTDGVDRPSRIEINWSFSNTHAPEMEMRNFSPFWLCNSPSIPPYCEWTMIGYTGFGESGDTPSEPSNATMKTEGSSSWLSDLGLDFMGSYIPNWTSLMGSVSSLTSSLPNCGSCDTCFIILILLPVPVIPSGIDNGEGDVTVSVHQFRSGGSQMRFWQMLYPAGGILSQATAHYNSSSVGGGWGKPKGRANLQAGGML